MLVALPSATGAQRIEVDWVGSPGGICPGAHGIGCGKPDCIEAVSAVKAIKRTLDPHASLNPGNVV